MGLCHGAWGADQPEDRPKIGLVLAGGGARGGAHIGVLKALEQHHVPVDYIAGTSFGAIVGAFYAAGYSADELEVLLDRMDWEELLRDRAPRAGRTFQRKQDDAETSLEIELGIGEHGITLPTGLVRGNQLRLMLRRHLSRVAHIRDFDALPIPFRAVAADLETGEEVVLDSGDLSSAVLASMSVPGLFPPAERHGRLLVDGGVVNNMPVNVAKAMGADLVILVDIGTPLSSRSEITSVTKVFGQLMSLLTLKSRQAQLNELRAGDILLKPDLEGINLTDFDRAMSAIPKGYDAAQQRAEALDALALDDEAWAAYLAARTTVPSLPTIDFVTVANNSSLPDAYIRSMVRLKLGEEVDEVSLSEDLTRIYGTGYFDRVEYQLVKDADGTGVLIEAEERAVGKRFIRFGMSLSDDFSGNNNYNLAASYTEIGLNALGAEWRTRVQVGDSLAASTQFYQPLEETQRYFAIADVAVSSGVQGLIDDRGLPIGDVRLTEGRGRIGLGRNLSNIGRLTLGLSRGIARINIRASHLQVDPYTVQNTNLFAILETDTFDNNNFPHSGHSFGALYSDGQTFLGGQSTVNTLQGGYAGAYGWGRNTLIGFASGGLAFGGDGTEADNFSLGGFLNLSGLRAGQISGRYFGMLGAAYYYRLNRGGIASLFGVPVYAGASLELGNAWNRSDDIGFDNLRYGGSLFLGAETPIGPLYLGTGYTGGQADRQFSAFMYLGRPF